MQCPKCNNTKTYMRKVKGQDKKNYDPGIKNNLGRSKLYTFCLACGYERGSHFGIIQLAKKEIELLHCRVKSLWAYAYCVNVNADKEIVSAKQIKIMEKSTNKEIKTITKFINKT